MPQITQVEPQKKNNKRYNVFLDGKFAFGADEDLVVSFRLIKGKEIDNNTLQKILFEAGVGKLMERMYILFAIRQRSEKEVRDYLKNLSFKRKLKGQEELSEVVIEALIEKLKQKELLQDLEFAKNWVQARSTKKGKIAIQSELIKKGISKELIEEVLNENNLKTQKQTAFKLLEKKFKSTKALDKFELKKKAYEFLLRRGFEYSTVCDIVESFLKKE